MRAQIVLFDIDGVLLLSGGYRAGLRQSLAFFLNELGLDDLWLPDENELAAFESIGVTAEWDMIPLWLGIVLETLARQANEPVFWSDWQTAADWAQSAQVTIERRPYVEDILAIRPLLAAGIIASETVYQFCLQQRFEPLLTISTQGVLRELMSHTRDISINRITQTFQAFILGSETYANQIRQDVPFTCPSALEIHDRPQLHPPIAARLEELLAEKRLAAAAFTARPSLPPDGRTAVHAGYTPEAEIALRILGMSHIPLIGYGAMVYVGEQVGLLPDSLLKPAPFQALAAMSAAWSSEILPSLEWAYAFNRRFDSSGSLPDFSSKNPSLPPSLPDTFDLHVFEDTLSGIRSVRRAADLLGMDGIRANVKAWGVASNEAKKTALEQVGAVVYSDVNQAIRAAFPEWF